MPKYMIQDIVPPEKRRAHAGRKPSVPAHSKKESDSSPKESSPVIPPADARRSAHPKDDEQEIEDLLPENPRAMILEHLYEDTAKSAGTDAAPLASLAPKDTPVADNAVTSGAWPYNEKGDGDSMEEERRILPQFPTYKSDDGRGNSWIPWIVIPSILLVIAFLSLNAFAQAVVSIIPKHDTIPLEVDKEFSAHKDPAADELGYAVMKVSLEDMIEVSATGTKTVTAKASGLIVIYNEQTASQRLIKNTRFESVAGKIYRINDSVVVPKATTPKGGKLTPGSLEVTVYADEAGPDHNSDPTDFTVPGLKDLPQYKKVYARSKGPITGGASGTIKTVTDQDMRQASDDLRVSLETKLRSRAHADLAPSQIGYENGIVVALTEPKLSTTKASRDDRAVVTQSGTLYFVVFDRARLAQTLAKTLIPNHGDDPVSITNLESLSFAMPKEEGDTLWSGDTLLFTLAGSPEITWVVNEEKVKQSLVGIPKSQFNAVMGGFSTIERAKGVMRPFWKSTYPSELDNITVKIVNTLDE